jgi:glycine hydroxymethyltransferase
VHLALIDLHNIGISGVQCQRLLESVDITTNKNVVPFDEHALAETSGIRVGSPAVTTRGFREPEMQRTGELILAAIAGRDDAKALTQVREQVGDLLAQFPLYEWL